ARTREVQRAKRSSQGRPTLRQAPAPPGRLASNAPKSARDRDVWRQKRRTESQKNGHGGAGWTRTTDNAIMSRALYHLSYGTAARNLGVPAKSRRRLRSRRGSKLTEPPERAPSACASSAGACRLLHVFSCSFLGSVRKRNQRPLAS